MFNSTFDTKRQLRALEAIALFATVVALVVTRWSIEAGVATEGNPVTAHALATLGWYPTAGIALGTVSGMFALYRRVVDDYPRLILGGAAAITAVSVLDVGWNALAVARVEVGTALPVEFAAVVALGTVVLVARPPVRVEPGPRPTTKQARAVGVALVLVISLVAMPFASGGVASADTSEPSVARGLDVAAGMSLQTSGDDNGTVYVGSSDNNLYALDAGTGDREWEYAAGGDILDSSPTVANGTVYVGSHNNSLHAIDAVTGNQEWSYATGDLIDSSPTIANGTVYVGSNDNSLYAIDAVTGDKEWSYATGDLIDSSPTIANGTVYVGSWDNNLYAIDAATGDEEWSYTTGNAIYDTSPTVSNGTVYVGSADDNLYAIDAGTGNKEWEHATGNTIDSSPTVVDGTVYVGSGDNNLYAVDAATGNEVWSYATGDGLYSSSPTVADGTVYVGSGDNSLYAVDAATGNKEWSYATGSGIESSPTVADGTVYVGSGDNNLYAVDAATGDEEWSYATGNTVDSSPTYVSSDSATSDGSRVTLGTLGHVGDITAAGGTAITGTAVDQNGNPLPANTTITAWGPTEAAFDTSDAQELDRKAEQLTDELSTPLPQSWRDFTAEFQTGNGLLDAKKFTNGIDGTYPLVHEPGDWNKGRTGALKSEVGQPRTTVSTSEDVIISLWDASEEPT